MQGTFHSKEKILDTYLSKAKDLKSLIEVENEHLSRSQLSKIKEYSEDKESLITEIEDCKKTLVADKFFLQNLPLPIKNQLIEVSEDLKKIAEKNNYEVKVAMEVNKLVLEAIQNAVTTNRQSNVAYSNKGSSYQNVYTGSPIKIDEVY
jgi:flagellar biosynthesis/type III secretory pathway chaperone